MSSRSKQEQMKSLSHNKILSALALSLVLISSLCPWTEALESTGAAAGAPSTGQSAPAVSSNALDQQLDKFQKEIDDNTLSVDEFQKLADLAGKNPTNSRAHLLCGRGFDLQGLPDQAVAEYEIADKYGPKDPEAIAAMLHNVLAKGAGEAANALLNSAIKRFPNNPEILFMIGKRLKENRHPEQAGKALVQAYKLGKKVQGLPSELGDMLVDQDPQKAIALAKEDLASNPDFAPALIVLAKGLMLQGKYEPALGPLKKLYKQSAANQETTAMYLRSLFWCGDYKTALEPALYCLRSDAQFVTTDLRSATTLAKVASNLPASYVSSSLQYFYEQTDKVGVPVAPPFHYYVGRMFFRQYRFPQAKAELLHYLDADPNSALTMWMLGYIAENSDHDYKAALQYYRLAHALLPNHAGITNTCLALEERMEDGQSDWAWCLRNWLYSRFSWGQH
jgi:tetratricopeptide (TPR) repeat protein